MSSDGTRLAVWRSGDGPPLVLVHGTTVNHADWAPVVPALSQRFSVYALDRRGCGASGDSAEYALAREFEDVAAVVDAAGAPAYLVAHSFGALISLEAARLTSHVRKLVLYEPPIPVPSGPEFHPPRLRQRLQALLANGQADEVVATFLEEVARQDPRRVRLQQRAPSWRLR
ncbi:MAG TPA: alpha/beta fold hydrolase, partial [Chloroflexota bacterium]